MELPILYALTYPERLPDPALRTYDPVKASPLTFEEIDHDAFPLFALGAEAGRRGGSAPAAFNAGNEIAVQAFLEGRVRFTDMGALVEQAMDRVGAHPVRDIRDVLAADEAARAAADEAASLLGKRSSGVAQ